MNKLKLFIENFLIYGLGGVASKMVPLIMVPIVTNIMPSTSYYGISDLFHTIVQFASALAIMGMYDAMYRLFFEKEDENYQKSVCSTTFIFTLTTSMIVFLLIILLKDFISVNILKHKNFINVVYLIAMATLVSATNSIVSAPTRMQNKRKVFLVTNIISPVLSYAISIPVLLAGHYLVALPMAAVISGLTMELIFYILNHKWFSLRHFDAKLLKPLLVIAIPLLPNFLLYWVFNSCDKIMITNILGVDAEGIYAVASKMGQVSQLIYIAFSGGWQFFSFSTMKDSDQVKTNSIVFEYLGVISFAATAFICAGSYLVFKLFFKAEYLSGYISAPYLFLAPLLQMLFQIAINQFLIIKKTWPNMFILGIGAIVNVMLNLILIPVIGIEGASIATLIGYALADFICVVVLCKMKLMVVSKRFISSVVVFLLFMISWRFIYTDKFFVGVIVAIILSLIYILIYKKDILTLLSELKKGKIMKNE